MRGLMKSGVLYTLALVVSVVPGVVATPFVVSVAGSAVWAAIAVAQAVAAIVIIFVGMGWPIFGPAWFGAADNAARGDLIRGSVVVRVSLLCIGLPSYVIAVNAVTPESTHVLAALLGGGATLAGAVTSAWAFPGEARPLRLLWIDSFPRAVGTTAGVLAMVVSSDVLWFVSLQCAGAAFAAIVSTVDLWVRYPTASTGRTVMANGLRMMRRGVYAVITSGSAAAFVNLPLILLAPSGGSSAVYAMSDRLLRYGVLASTPVQRVLQAHIPEARDPRALQERLKRSLRWVAAIGVVFAAAFAMLAPLASDLLSAGQIELPIAVSIPFGLALGAITITGVIGPVILPLLGSERHMALSTVVAAVATLPVIIIVGTLGSASAMAWAMCAAEVIVLAYQGAVIYRLVWRRGGFA